MLVKPPRVLVADPNAHMAKLLVAMLQGFGIDGTRTVPDGAEALSAIREMRPDIVLIERRLPIFDAFDVVTHVRQNRWAEPRWLLVASDLTRPVVMRARDAGFAAVLVKPISPQVLRARLLPTLAAEA